ncbi:MAG: peptide chain release factor N(5)-glutamine methyltransferase [Gammaproteobacteria bacterium]|nr:peptide chain release factor N(5)-glutamine methyltransferase [Gammaproteobacteria bacterium]
MIDPNLPILLCHVLKKPRSFLLTYPDYQPSDQEQAEFNALKVRYEQGEPVAYLIGKKGFWNHYFKVTPDVLIPRPETELLLELALHKVPRSAQVIELGTGSGCLAISFALERPDCQVMAVDLSENALAIAKENAVQLKTGAIVFIQSNWFDALPPQKVEAILSNPPYIEKQDSHLKDLRFEPELALVSGESGLEAIELIIKQARFFLKPGGFLALEHGYNQKEAVQALFQEYQYYDIETRLDLQAHPRVTWGHV